MSFYRTAVPRNFLVTAPCPPVRVLGALLSAHLLIIDPEKPFGELDPGRYDGELLGLAHDLAARLLPAFEETGTGLPHPRVSLRYPPACRQCQPRWDG